MKLVKFYKWRSKDIVAINPSEVSSIESGSDPYFTQITMKNSEKFGVHATLEDVEASIDWALENTDTEIKDE